MQSLVTEIDYDLLSIDEIKTLVQEEFQSVDNLIINHLYSNIPLIEKISEHIIKSGGKRLRPLLVLLVSKAFNYQGVDHVSLAAVVEFLHTATLLHDDVIDNSALRRGQQTANAIWGNATSVLVGDFIYSRTFEILTRLQNIQVMDILARTTNIIAEGEVLQLVNRNDSNINENDYMTVIRNKTAKLFEAAAEVAALICHCSTLEQQAMANFGLHLGIAFQLVDDVLDYSGNTTQLGKNMGDDLAEGKSTLPLIHAMQHASDEKSQFIKEAIKLGGLNNVEPILEAMQETKSLEYTMNKAEEQVQLARNALAFIPHSPYRNALASLTEFALNRNY